MSNEPRDFLWLHLRDLPYFRAMLRAVEAEFYQAYPLPHPILDVGCGDGHFASVAFNTALDVGLDPWSIPIQKARKFAGYKSLVQADGCKMPFPDQYFASAISNSVLEHIPQVQEVLVEAGRVLKPGAPLIFCVPNPRYISELAVPAWLRRLNLSKLAGSYEKWFIKMSRVHHAVMPDTWGEWLEAAGFEMQKWWHYFSPDAMRMLELGHYFGAPTLLPHLLTGRWILAPYRWNLALTERLVRRYVKAEEDESGCFTFFVAIRKQT